VTVLKVQSSSSPYGKDRDIAWALSQLRKRHVGLQEMSSLPACEQLRQDEEELIRVLDVVLEGGGCFMSADQFRDLFRNRAWLDLALFQSESEQEQENGDK
jgi:hypothetical protein